MRESRFDSACGLKDPNASVVKSSEVEEGSRGTRTFVGCGGLLPSRSFASWSCSPQRHPFGSHFGPFGLVSNHRAEAWGLRFLLFQLIVLVFFRLGEIGEVIRG